MLRDLKNSVFDKHALNRELTRMQQIDRLKSIHAMDLLISNDNHRFLPSLETSMASNKGSSSAVGGLQDSLLQGSTISENDIVVKSELRDICERFGKRPNENNGIKAG
jgi:hypothetical protein